MARRMLIDASHPEETRVVVVDGTRLEEFDFETATRKPLKGNIYLAKVIRIEPSLQAAFVEYGGNRHGFLAFSEIHPDYYQIPVADRERLIAEQQRLAAEADEDHEPRRRGRVDRNLQCRQPLDRQPEGAISADLNRGILHMRRNQGLHHLKKRFAQKLLRLTDQQQGRVRRLVGAKIARDGAEGSNGVGGTCNRTALTRSRLGLLDCSFTESRIAISRTRSDGCPDGQ